MKAAYTIIDRRSVFRMAGAAATTLTVGALLGCGGDEEDPGGGETSGGLLDAMRERGHAVLGIVDSPNGSMQRDGEVVGYNVDIVKAVLRKHDINEFEAFQADFPGMVSGLVAKRFDICCAGLLITEERCDAIAMTDPVNVLIYSFVVPSGNPEGLASIEDIKTTGLKLAVESATTQERVAREILDEEQILTVSSRQDGADAIRINRASAYLAPVNALVALLEGVDDMEITETVPDMPKIGSSIAARLEDRDFVETFNQDFAELKESGEYEEIMTGYDADPSLIELPGIKASC